MKNPIKIRNYTFLAVVLYGVIFSSCRSNKPTPPDNKQTNTKQTPTTDRRELTNDSLFLYAKEVYFWNDKLPTYDQYEPRKYRSELDLLDNYNENLYNIVKSSGSPDFDARAEDTKYSYIFDQSDKNPTASVAARKSAVDLEGHGNDIGIRFGYYGSNSNFKILVTAVYENSPADHAGFVRGDEITSINGVSYGTNFSSQIDKIIAAVDGETVTLAGTRSTGSFNTTLNKTLYTSNPIYKSTVLNAGTKKIGFLAYSRFSDMDNSMNALNAAFDDFASKGVTDLIIDLRYNGGGYINTAIHLTNLIAPTGTSGVMFAEHYNATMRNKQATILKNQPNVNANGRITGTYFDEDYSVAANTVNFAKTGPLGTVKNVVFIVTSSTASASELVINNLKPYMNVKLVGETTYGKPVGFFPITIENKYDVYYAMFETKNSKGQGGYFNGMSVDAEADELANDDKMYDWGNINDPSTSKALNILAPGVTVSSKAKSASVKPGASGSSLRKLGGNKTNPEFIGMIEDRK
jgi:carboxyl-terminal processing protease